jgi:hypothetical protein
MHGGRKEIVEVEAVRKTDQLQKTVATNGVVRSNNDRSCDGGGAGAMGAAHNLVSVNRQTLDRAYEV